MEPRARAGSPGWGGSGGLVAGGARGGSVGARGGEGVGEPRAGAREPGAGRERGVPRGPCPSARDEPAEARWGRGWGFQAAEAARG